MIVETPFYKIVPYVNLLHVSTFLSWDEDVVGKHIEAVKGIVATLYNDKPWGLLSDRTEWELGTPKAEKLFSDKAWMSLNKTLTHIAIVIGNSELKKWQLSNMTKRFSQYEIKFFQNLHEAESWLAIFGYQRENEII